MESTDRLSSPWRLIDMVCVCVSERSVTRREHVYYNGFSRVVRRDRRNIKVDE